MVKIITDDGSDLSIEDKKKFEIIELDMPINDGERDYITDIDITRDELYTGMENGVVYKTAQIKYTDLYKEFEKAYEEKEPVIYITLSSALSGTYQTAKMAKEEFLEGHKDAKIEIIDSLSATVGMASLVIRARKLEQEGLEFDDLVEKIKLLAERTQHVFTVGTLEYLYRGGRVSKSSKVLGGILNIRPVMIIDKKDGSLKSADKARGSKAFYKKLSEKMDKLSANGKFDKNQTVIIAHGRWTSEIEILKDYLINDMGILETNIVLSNVGAVIGAHTGPEVLVVSFLSDTGLCPYFEI